MAPWALVIFVSGLISTASAEELQFFINVESNPHDMIESGEVSSVFSFDPAEMEKIVRQYLKLKNSKFEIGKTEARIFIPRKTNYMAAVWYAPDKGKTALLCKLDFDGKVIDETVGVAIRRGDEFPPLMLATELPNVQSGVQTSLTNLVTPSSVDRLVRAYAREQKANSDFSEIKGVALAVPRSRDYLVGVDYASVYRKPILRCAIDYDLRITKLSVRVAVPH
jgi:hypothetical protein